MPKIVRHMLKCDVSAKLRHPFNNNNYVRNIGHTGNTKITLV